MTAPWDPVRARRKQVERWTLLANRIGWLFMAVSMSVFVIGFALGFTGPLVGIVFGSLVVGSILLAPSIILKYAINAAEKDDRARGF